MSPAPPLEPGTAVRSSGAAPPIRTTAAGSWFEVRLALLRLFNEELARETTIETTLLLAGADFPRGISLGPRWWRVLTGLGLLLERSARTRTEPEPERITTPSGNGKEINPKILLSWNEQGIKNGAIPGSQAETKPPLNTFKYR